MPLVPVIVDMQRAGVKLDVDALAEVVCGTIARSKEIDFPIKYDEVRDDVGYGNEFVDKAVEVQSSYWEL